MSTGTAVEADRKAGASRWTAAALAAALVFGAATILAARDRRVPLGTTAERALYVRSPRVARALAVSAPALSADLYWLRAIQHFGGDRLSRQKTRPFELLEPLLNLTTSLDPRFVAAYRFGAIFLSEPPPGGPGRADAAIALLEKGLSVSPDKWQYAHDIGFVVLWQSGDARTAAEWFRRAAAMPGAPNWLGPLAATTMLNADRGAARTWLTDLERTAAEPWIQRIAAQRLMQLDAMDQIEALQSMVPAFQQKMNRNPQGWEDFQAAGLLRGTPVDPAGFPYRYFPASGRVRLDPASPLGPLPLLPGAVR